ncbi:hypothetical protein ACHHYP_02129 [Achlya hypogyna]|uniref:Transmembrane protein n=1 Tax=Achlya hypogyna TaxID=1202772 RepID=A0A1V9Z7A2_ACHHY|nr:hypothetical protein ACHHYP_02129 [Achlya hypogyna]
MLRTFYGSAELSADWTGEYEEKSAQWFELFLDLIMVAACSNVAEGFKDDLTVAGFLEFILLCLMYSSSWHLYTHFNARFSETSLLHYSFLYLLLMGLGSMVLASEPGYRFTIGLVSIRIAMVLMNSSVICSLPEARAKARIDIALGVIAITLFISALVIDTHTWTIAVYLLTLVLETLAAFVVARCFPGSFVAMNIDHVDEREGCMVMVALGESVVSAFINSRGADLPAHFYMATCLSLLVIFSLAIFYFATKPPRAMHAMRRSVYSGFAYSLMHYALLPTLLATGVGTKLVSEAVLKATPLSSNALWVLYGSISLALLEMLVIRLLHYWGRQPAPSDPIDVKRIKYAWWAICAVSPLCPLGIALIFEVANPRGVAPISALVGAAAVVLFWLVSETSVMHCLRVLGYGYSGTLEKKRDDPETLLLPERTV